MPTVTRSRKDASSRNLLELPSEILAIIWQFVLTEGYHADHKIFFRSCYSYRAKNVKKVDRAKLYPRSPYHLGHLLFGRATCPPLLLVNKRLYLDAKKYMRHEQVFDICDEKCLQGFITLFPKDLIPRSTVLNAGRIRYVPPLQCSLRAQSIMLLTSPHTDQNNLNRLKPACARCSIMRMVQTRSCSSTQECHRNRQRGSHGQAKHHVDNITSCQRRPITFPRPYLLRRRCPNHHQLAASLDSIRSCARWRGANCSVTALDASYQKGGWGCIARTEHR